METVDIIIRKTKHSRIGEVDFLDLSLGGMYRITCSCAII